MANILAYDSNSIQTLFSSLNTGSKTTSSIGNWGINLADYASLRSGSYGKLLRSYYSEVVNGGETSKNTSKNISKTIATTSTAKDSTETLARVESAAEGLKESADALFKKGKTSVFEKKSITDEEGNTTYDYDTDKIYKAVKDFTEKYNSVVSEVKDSKVSGIQSAASSMIRMTKINEKMLGKIGITIGEDNKLSLSEEDFKKADMNQVKSMFNTTGAYGYQMSAQASIIDYHAQNEASKANTYNKSGMYNYNYNSGNIYSSTM